jgi:hypothetical protein
MAERPRITVTSLQRLAEGIDAVLSASQDIHSLDPQISTVHGGKYTVRGRSRRNPGERRLARDTSFQYSHLGRLILVTTERVRTNQTSSQNERNFLALDLVTQTIRCANLIIIESDTRVTPLVLATSEVEVVDRSLRRLKDHLGREQQALQEGLLVPYSAEEYGIEIP